MIKLTPVQYLLAAFGLLGVFFAAVKFLGPDASQVTGFITTLAALLLGAKGGETPPPPADSGSGKPDLKLISSSVGLLSMFALISGCAAAALSPEDLNDIAATNAKIDACAKVAYKENDVCKAQDAGANVGPGPDPRFEEGGPGPDPRGSLCAQAVKARYTACKKAGTP